MAAVLDRTTHYFKITLSFCGSIRQLDDVHFQSGKWGRHLFQTHYDQTAVPLGTFQNQQSLCLTSTDSRDRMLGRFRTLPIIHASQFVRMWDMTGGVCRELTAFRRSWEHRHPQCLAQKWNLPLSLIKEALLDAGETEAEEQRRSLTGRCSSALPPRASQMKSDIAFPPRLGHH